MPELEHQPREVAYRGTDLTSVHINLPTRLWHAVGGLARYLGTNKTNIVVRALDNYAYLTQVLDNDRSTKVFIVHGNGDREQVPFPELARAGSATSFGPSRPQAASQVAAQNAVPAAVPRPAPSGDSSSSRLYSRIASREAGSPLVSSNPLEQGLPVSPGYGGAHREVRELELVG
jgi:hypothetical protein